jgi:Big-like domain-containing protein/carbohydrate binding protein with CBM6 domain
MFHAARKLTSQIHRILLAAAMVVAATCFTAPGFAQTLPQPPRIFLDTTYAPPTGGLLITVNAGGNLQAAINSALPGDTIVLQAGATFTGNFTLPNKSGSGWIYIRSSAYSSLPAPGTRVSPAQANLMPKIVSPNTSPAITADFGAHHYRFVGIEIATTWSVTTATHFNVMLFGYNLVGNPATSLSQLPTDITIDRCWLHGTPTGNVRRGILADAIRFAVVDSYFSDFHEIGEAQAINVNNGAGPFKIVNNELQGSTENIIFGGNDPTIANLVPSDIEIRGNHFFKPLSWKVGHPSYAGIHWTVKNLLEFKNAQRVLVDGNILENNWADSQNGMSILLTPRNQNGGCPWCIVQDITITHNILRHAGGGINLSSSDNFFPSQMTTRVLIKDNMFNDIGNGWGGPGRLFQVLALSSGGGWFNSNVTIDHNTGFEDVAIALTNDCGTWNQKIYNFIFRNNITPTRQSGFFGGCSGDGGPTLSTFYVNPVFTNNALAGSSSSNYSGYPGNFFPITDAAVGFVNLAALDYRLAATSLYKNAGTDGKDLGAAIDALNAATSCALTGACGDPPPPPAPGTRSPHLGSPFTIPGVMQAEDFDNGGEGVAYHDLTPGNQGGFYRTTEDVDIIASCDPSVGGYVVNNFETGEWMEYTITVAQSGKYRIAPRVSSAFTGSAYHVEIDRVNVTGSVTVPNTGGWCSFQDVGIGGVSLSAGQHVLRIQSEVQYFDINSITITAVTDTTPPAISLSAPINGTTVSGAAMTVSATASDNVGVVGVQFQLDGVNLGAELTSAPYSISWNSTLTANGAHTLTAVARDDAGNSSTAAGASITVANDTTPPTVSIAAPAAGSTVSGVILVSNSHSDNVGVVGVQFKLDGINLGAEVTNEPYSVSWNTTLVANGSHTLAAVARDAAGNTATSSVVSVSVSNFAPPGTRSPYNGAPALVPGILEAENFDLGGQGVAYDDLTPGNQGGLYRTTEDGDIIASCDPAGGGYVVNNFQTGEWMEYTITVAQSGTYRLVARVSSGYTGTAYHMEVDRVNVTGSVTVPNTGGWCNFQDVEVAGGVGLSAGQHVLRVQSDVQYFNMNSITITALPTVSITAPLNGANITNLTKVRVKATSGIGLSSVQVYGDSSLIGTVSCTTNSCSDLVSTVRWLTSGLATGPHSLYAVATDALGNSYSSSPITVNK